MTTSRTRTFQNLILGFAALFIAGIILYVTFGPSSSRIFFVQGVNHILTGYDHILFVVAIHLVVRKVLNIFKIITAFTLAHSATLILTALGIINLPAKLVESAIALTILIMAGENIQALIRGENFKSEFTWRWILTGFFGLIHGLGFAGFLKELFAQSQQHLVPGVIGFNLGVEAGQFIIVAILLPILWLLGKNKKIDQYVSLAASGAIGIVAGIWFVTRVMA